MKRINKCVELLKLAYISRVPIAWIVVNEKDVAQQIATGFFKQHFGGIYDIGNSSPLKGISALEHNTFVKKSPTPAVYFGWVDKRYEEENKNTKLSIASLLSTYLDFYLNIEFETTSGPILNSSKVSNAWNRNFVIITSPDPPLLGWMNSYIETIYLLPIQDNEINGIISNFSNINNIELSKDFIDKLVVNFRGISERQIESVLIKCLAEGLFDNLLINESDKENGELILQEIRKLKRQMLEGYRGLKWITIRDDEPQAAGLDGITNWLEERQFIFSDPERSYSCGYDVPKGLIITGVPGTGKSLMAKQAARILKLPLIAMDIGDIQESNVGSSEENMANALRKVDDVSPCVLWIDEIEKAFSGAESGQSDSGVMRRMFGKFLTWMQEKTSYCFVLATSNDITKLPPELFRSQRFDEKFYTFMPSAQECAKMFVANIRLHNERIINSNGLKINIFDSNVFEKESYWFTFLNDKCTCNVDSRGNMIEEAVMLDDNGKWLKGYLPQKKLFTGADIATFVSYLKFKVLSQRDKMNSPNFGFTGPIKKIEVDYFISSVLGAFIPYGQSNLCNIASCFLSLAKNRFKSASEATDDDAIISFSDYDELNQTIRYNSEKFSDDFSTYNRTLYMCIVGAINSLQKK